MSGENQHNTVSHSLSHLLACPHFKILGGRHAPSGGPLPPLPGTVATPFPGSEFGYTLLPISSEKILGQCTSCLALIMNRSRFKYCVDPKA